MKPWIIKYVPTLLSDIEGQNKALDELKSYVLNFKNQKKKAAFLYGPTGCGKTASAYALAKELNYEVLEFNASDVRNKDQLLKTVGMAIKTQSFFYKGKIILLDEVDGLSGHKDRGGAITIAKLLDETKFPLILTAINPFDKKMSALRKKANMIEMNTLEYGSVYNVLAKICDNENVKYEDSV